MDKRYLTKSRFKLAMESPTKLFYTGKKEYANKTLDDSFLKSLADGGFQVGELAKLYYPGGHDIVSLDYEESLAETNRLLQEENCIIYEAAIKHGDFFVRVDVLIKEGNQIKLIEVKAKSTSGTTDEQFLGKRKNTPILATWKPYIEDIAFQNYVAEKSMPEYEITPYLMLVNKNAKAPTEGLNQKFKINKDEKGRTSVTVSDQITEEDLAGELLIPINVEKACQIVYGLEYNYMNKQFTFDALIHEFAYHYKNDIKIAPVITNSYREFEFIASEEEMRAGKKSGYHEDFKEAFNWEDSDFEEDTVFDLWDNRSLATQLKEGKIKLSDLNQEDINYVKIDGELSRTERQWMQIEKSKNKDTDYWIDKEGLRKEMDSWKFPYHFIDFETAQPAIPFNKGRRPYEGIAFQFSHHIVYEDGEVEHKGEYLNVEPGAFPNYEFVRALKKELGNDEGTIFIYSPHENSYLNMIYNQLMEENEENEQIEDREGLCDFIREITTPGKGDDRESGPRAMVDMHKLVVKYYYDPYMKGSNSIKVVLPAILNSSTFVKEKYSKPIYGAAEGIKSLNFQDWTWVKEEDGVVLNPYTLLPRLFTDVSDKDNEILGLELDEISDGGAATTAYGRLQFENIPSEIRDGITKGLLKYCELDTLAMVIIYEAWKDMIK